jgi:hypothetical protein
VTARAAVAASRLRARLLAVSALATTGIAGELVLIGHWGSAARLVPWVVLAGTAGCTVAVARGPTSRSINASRGYAIVAASGAWWGVIEHLIANGRFVQELHASWGLPAVLWAALRGGVPVLAPAAVALPAVLVAVATVEHPALTGRSDLAAVDRATGTVPDPRPVVLRSSPQRSAVRRRQ